jgi:hypothetical protein
MPESISVVRRRSRWKHDETTPLVVGGAQLAVRKTLVQLVAIAP